MTSSMGGATPQMLADLVNAVRGRVVEGVRVHDARAFTDLDEEGEPIVRLVVLLDDPPPGERTWPAGVDRLNPLVRQEAMRLGISEWVFVSRIELSEAELGGFSSTMRSA